MSGELLTPGEVLGLLKQSFLSSFAECREEYQVRDVLPLVRRTPREDAEQQVVVTF